MEDDERLLAEQIVYYRAVAPEYLDDVLDIPASHEVVAAVEAFAPTGDVLELACGPGTWTPCLLRAATTVTAVDASPEMLDLARERVGDDRVTYVRADLFTWRPERRWDAVFFGFWLSHVPRPRFDAFWRLVSEALAPGGRVFFVDDAHRTPEELIEGPDSSTIRRRMRDGTPHRAIKVPHAVDDLERRLAVLGWEVAVHPIAGAFYWGEGRRA